MNLYNEDEKRDGAPVVPSGASSFKKASAFGKPMFSRTAGGIMERLKNLSRKDMAFVGIGLSVLVGAPVAEYMTSKPSADNLLTPGFGSRDGAIAGGGVYEPGINALSQGSPDGSGEVITPLSSRDPASLILGSQPAQPVMAAVSAPPSTGFRDSMKDVGRSAFSEVAKSAGAPTPIPRMQSAMRNLGSFFSGGENSRTAGTLGGGKIIDDARSASSKTAGRSMVGPVATAGYKGVASNTPNSSSKGAYDKLRAQADKAAGNFTDGSAMSGLDKAAADSIDIGSGAGGLGSGQNSEKTTSPSNSTNKYEHSRSGESLEEMAAKQRMQKALDWEFFKKYEIPKQIINAVVGAVSTTLGKFISGQMEGALNMGGGAAPDYVCLGLRFKGTATDPKDCDTGGTLKNTIVKLTSNDEKTVGSWTSGSATADKTCPCSALRADLYKSMMSGAGTSDNPAGTTPQPGAQPVKPTSATSQLADPAVVSAALKPVFDKYDSALSMMVAAALSGSATSDPAELLRQTRSLAGGFGNLNAIELAGNITKAADASAIGTGAVAAYESGVLSTEKKISQYETDYNDFSAKLAAVVAAANANPPTLAIKQQGAANATSKAAVEPMRPELAMDQKTLKQKEGLLSEAKTKVAIHRKRLEAYQTQLGFVKNGAEAINADYSEVRKQADKILEDLNAMPKDSALAGEDLVKVKAAFKTLSGRDSSVPDSVPAAAAKTSTRLDPEALAFNSNGITDFRDAPAPNSVLITNALVWRGLPADDLAKAFKGGAANDAAAITAEQTAWTEVSPFQKDPVPASKDNIAPKCLLAENLRNAKVSEEASGSKLDPAAETSKLAMITTEITDIRDRLTAMGIDMDNPTGATAGKPKEDPKPATGTGTTGTDTGAAANADGRPTATADNPHRFTPAERQKAEDAASLLSGCEDAVGGFKDDVQGKCSIPRSARVTGLTAPIDTYLPADKTLAKYNARVKIACDFVRQCASVKGSKVSVPDECAGLTSR